MTNPKVGIWWSPVRQILLRGSAGRGFRAPSLADLYAPETIGVSVPGLNDPLRCPVTNSSTDCGTQFPTTNGGNANLKPEKSKNLTVGFVLEPSPMFSAAVDYFAVELKDTINNGIPATFLVSDQVLYGAFIRRAPSTVPGLPGVIVNIDQRNTDMPGRIRGSVRPDLTFVPRKVGSYEIYDIQGSWTGLRNLKFTLGVRNIFDRDPPYTNLAGQVTFQSGYDPQYADPRGRFYYARATYSFK